MQTPQADDPDDQGETDRGAGAAGSFWRRYSGRDEAAGEKDATPTAEASHHCLEWCPICRGADLLRAAVPPELQDQFNLIQRDALLMAQAMIESQLEKMRAHEAARPDSAAGAGPGSEDGRDDGPDIESIPIQ